MGGVLFPSPRPMSQILAWAQISGSYGVQSPPGAWEAAGIHTPGGGGGVGTVISEFQSLGSSQEPFRAWSIKLHKLTKQHYEY